MNVSICRDVEEMGRQAADDAARLISRAIAERGVANIVVATGASQFEVLAALIASPGIDWPRVVGFHLDEYVGLPASHPASFRRYLKERFVDRVPLKSFHYLNGETRPHEECHRVGDLIRQHEIDIALVGIGENGHLAFNDPPADFDTQEPYIVVDLDEACRRQQLGEGWFSTLDEVPRQAVSMSIRQIVKSRAIVCSVPDLRKAEAVKDALQGPVAPHVPASILQQHPCVAIYLDPQAASRLERPDSRTREFALRSCRVRVC